MITMKTKLFYLALALLFSMMGSSQEAPVNPATPPSPPPAPPAPVQKVRVDTTKINIGGKKIIIIDGNDQESETMDESELLEEKREQQRELKEAQKELDEARRELEMQRRKNQEAEDPSKQLEEELKKAEDELLDAEKELKEAEMELNAIESDLQQSSRKQKNKLSLKLESKEGKESENRAPADHRKKRKTRKNKNAQIGFIDFDLGFNFLKFADAAPAALKDDLKLNTWGSLSTTVTFLPTKIYLGSPQVMLMTGLGWRMSQYHLKEKLNFEPNQTLVYAKQDDVRKSQFVTHYIQVPLCLYLESKKIKGLGRIGFGVGGYGGVMIHQEHELETENPNRFIETEEDFGFHDYRYGFTGRVDVGALKFYANFDANNLWKDNKIKNIECGIWFDF